MKRSTSVSLTRGYSGVLYINDTRTFAWISVMDCLTPLEAWSYSTLDFTLSMQTLAETRQLLLQSQESIECLFVLLRIAMVRGQFKTITHSQEANRGRFRASSVRNLMLRPEGLGVSVGYDYISMPSFNSVTKQRVMPIEVVV